MDTIALNKIRSATDEWNKWRRANSTVRVDLRGASLAHAHLEGIDLSMCDLRSADLREAALAKATLLKSDLRGANLEKSNLREARLDSVLLDGASLRLSYLSRATLTSRTSQPTTALDTSFEGAICEYTTFDETYLARATFDRAYLIGAMFTNVQLTQCSFDKATFGRTTFINTDLSGARFLETATHVWPSGIDAATIERSRGAISRQFLRGAGLGEISVRTAALHDPLLGEPETNYILDEIRSLHLKSPLAVGRVFISYAHNDATFVDRLEESLMGKGIRVWRDVRDLVAGRIDTQLRAAMRQQSVVIIVLSAASVNSDWVEWEVETARQMEKETQQHMLCPIALDSAWESAAWSAPLRNQITKYFVVDFSAWHEPEQFTACFSRLHAGLRASYRLR